MDTKKVLNLADEIFPKGCKLTEGQIVSFANGVYDLQVAEAAERVGVHRESSRVLAMLSSMARSGASPQVIGDAVIAYTKGEGALVEPKLPLEASAD
ncbi:hypothetical protein HNP46_000007 [Pseudomonas nitritireducens]|uniref:Uncharacterized protein n=1 Tax=Pseudomonas nitroreducens TaxID=46680 RepID=A0A7W7KEZ5_PSENT|nr:hypothetical protein [Pseudomonas nitritireducens]MBB4861196.1 hypothetical protein [Pseudomonas nitritireducens]